MRAAQNHHVGHNAQFQQGLDEPLAEIVRGLGVHVAVLLQDVRQLLLDPETRSLLPGPAGLASVVREVRLALMLGVNARDRG
jgi:hypothetical protein